MAGYQALDKRKSRFWAGQVLGGALFVFVVIIDFAEVIDYNNVCDYL